MAEYQRAIGPAIEDGFYFDFDFGDIKISEADFPKIEAKMREILPSWKSFEKNMLSSSAAKKEYPDNPYKHGMIDDFSGKGKKKARTPKKESWMIKVRAQRKFIRELQEKCVINDGTFRMLYKKVKGNLFRSRRHIKLYLEENKLFQKNAIQKEKTKKN